MTFVVLILALEENAFKDKVIRTEEDNSFTWTTRKCYVSFPPYVLNLFRLFLASYVHGLNGI